MAEKTDITVVLGDITNEQDVEKMKAGWREEAISLLRFIYSKYGDKKATEWLEERIKNNDNGALYFATKNIKRLADILKMGFVK